MPVAASTSTTACVPAILSVRCAGQREAEKRARPLTRPSCRQLSSVHGARCDQLSVHARSARGRSRTPASPRRDPARRRRASTRAARRPRRRRSARSRRARCRRPCSASPATNVRRRARDPATRSALRPCRSRSAKASGFFGTCPVSRMKRATASPASTWFCSKNSHWCTRARSIGSAGRKSVPSARYSRIAADSGISSPESSASTGTRPSGLRARCSGRRPSPLKRSIVTRSNADPQLAQQDPHLQAVGGDGMVVEDHSEAAQEGRRLAEGAVGRLGVVARARCRARRRARPRTRSR